jgi:hypothetical protein
MAGPPPGLNLPPVGSGGFGATYATNPYSVKVDGRYVQAAWIGDAWDVLPPNVTKPAFDLLDKVYGKGNWTSKEVNDLWKYSVKLGANAVAVYGVDAPTPEQLMLQRIPALAQNGLRPDGKLAKGVGGAGGVSVSFQKSVRLTEPGSARKLVDTALGQYLGRAATPEEQKTFLKALNVQEQADPTMTKSVTNSAGRTSSTTSTTTGGFDPAVFAEEYAQGQEGAGEYKAATSLLDTFIKSIGAKV